MKKGSWSAGLKKQTALMIHLLFLCLFLAGMTLVYFNENYGRGLSWVQEESYADTLSFTEQLESDVEMIFKYVNYKNLLELDGELNYEADMVCVTFSSGRTVIYTLDEMLRYAKSRGYYLTDTFDVAGGPSTPEKDMPNPVTPLIEWKAYAPNEVYKGPGDQYATREALSLQVLTLLGEYYQIKHNYIDNPANLHFRVSYLNDDGNEQIYTNAEHLSIDEFKSYGRYLYIDGESIQIDTNLSYVPNNITSGLEEYNLYGNNDYYIVLGLDTTYPNEDPYSIAHTEYEKIRVEYITGLLLFLIGGVGFLLTFIIMAGLTGHSGGPKKAITLHPYDHIPFECSVILLFMVLRLNQYLSIEYFVQIAYMIFNGIYWDYIDVVLPTILSYFICTFAFFSWLRNYKAGSLWTGSLIYRGYHRCTGFMKNCSFPTRMALSFAGYLFTSAILLGAFFFLYLQQDNLSFVYLYMVPAVIFFGFQIWTFLLLFRTEVENEKIAQGVYHMAEGETSYKIDTTGFSGKGEQLAESLNNLGDGLESALQEKVKSERLKADLITNVSHDIKTPLTSIINYVDLLKREKIQDEKIQRYLEILDQKSQRLKTLTEDLVEASKASSGNLKLDIAEIDLVEMIYQTNGEFEEKFQLRHLELVSTLPDDSILIAVDGRRLWRVLENLYNNAFKYAMEHSRVYVDVTEKDGMALFTIKNVSANPLNINADELTERFVRGDVARTTEGSGLGLSIAKSLTQLQGGTFQLYIDGDLFKAQVGFPIVQKEVS